MRAWGAKPRGKRPGIGASRGGRGRGRRAHAGLASPVTIVARLSWRQKAKGGRRGSAPAAVVERFRQPIGGGSKGRGGERSGRKGPGGEFNRAQPSHLDFLKGFFFI